MLLVSLIFIRTLVLHFKNFKFNNKYWQTYRKFYVCYDFLNCKKGALSFAWSLVPDGFSPQGPCPGPHVGGGWERQSLLKHYPPSLFESTNQSSPNGLYLLL